MGVSAVVKNGEIQETASQSSVKQASASKNGMDKEAFLQLLVAQMKYQDPLEPTSNTDPDNGFCRKYQGSTGHG